MKLSGYLSEILKLKGQFLILFFGGYERLQVLKRERTGIFVTTVNFKIKDTVGYFP